MEKLMSPGHIATKWWNWDSNPGSQPLGCTPRYTRLCQTRPWLLTGLWPAWNWSPRTWCGLIPTRSSLLGKEESIITGFPSHRDVIPRGLLLAVGNLAPHEPSALCHGTSGSKPMRQGGSRSSHSTRSLFFI